jgi:type III secretion system FlhB-like substrate exporter
MELPVMLREALELQILEQEPEQAATVVGTGVSEHGAVAVAQALLEATAVAFRRMVSITDEAFDLADLLTRLALDGAIPEHRLELLTDILTAAAATAGGIRPSVDALQTRLGDQDLLFGAWLGTLTGLRVASLAIEVTETELLEDVLLAFDAVEPLDHEI